jgi:hypothetical protein
MMKCNLKEGSEPTLEIWISEGKFSPNKYGTYTLQDCHSEIRSENGRSPEKHNHALSISAPTPKIHSWNLSSISYSPERDAQHFDSIPLSLRFTAPES